MMAAVAHTGSAQPPGPLGVRMFSWLAFALTMAYCAAAVLIYWFEWPSVMSLAAHYGLVSSGLGITKITPGNEPFAWMVIGLYLGSFALAAIYVVRSSGIALRADAQRLTAIAAYIVRAAFWMVLIVGVVDSVISFLRVEGMLEPLVGKTLADDLGRPALRGLWVHYPLIVVSLVIAFFVRSLGFTWLALLVVVAELTIVISRFIFSYEQAFQGDVVRFWYAALFLLASPYTLIEEGHVRVDVLYAGFSQRTKGFSNTIGTVLLGMSFCAVILALGMWTKSSVITAPLLSFEISQQGFGMFTKYLMAGLLGIFAMAMQVQFCSYLLEAVADWRGDPGHRDHEGEMM